MPKNRLMGLLVVAVLFLNSCSTPALLTTETSVPTDLPGAVATETPIEGLTSVPTKVPVTFTEDSCLVFEDGQYAQADEHLIPLDSSFTIEMWVYDWGGGGEFVEFISQESNAARFYLGTTAGTNILRAGDSWEQTGITMPKNIWTHLALTHSRAGGDLYLNGELVASINNGYIFGGVDGTPTRLGSQFGDPTEFFSGCLDEVKIFQSIRTGEEIKEDMARGVDSTDSNLVAYYDFNDKSNSRKVPQGSGHPGNELTLSIDGSWNNSDDVSPSIPISPVIGLSDCKDSSCGAYVGTDGVRITQGYQSGFGWYSTIWPMLTEAPGPEFQMGLGSTWINPDLRNPSSAQVKAVQQACGSFGADWGTSQWILFQSIEGGFGYWVDTRFKSAMPKWRFNATPDCYATPMRSSPGWPFGGTTSLSQKDTGLVQLSNRMLIAPDGQTFPLTTNGEVLGVAWMALPFPEVGQTEKAPTGSNTWTLFVNSENFKGPLAYYQPQFFSDPSQKIPELAGMGLDTRPGYMGGMASEIGYMPMVEVIDEDGTLYSKIPQLRFPVDENGHTILSEDLKAYSNAAFSDQFVDWLNGASDTVGPFAQDGSLAVPITVSQQTQYYQNGDAITDLTKEVRAAHFDSGTAFGFQWTDSNSDGQFPVFFRKNGNVRSVISADEVPDSTGLKGFSFKNKSKQTEAYIGGNWWDVENLSTPGGTVTLTDGSTVTYVWFKFVDQPALRRLNLSDSERDTLQAMVEKMHRTWPIDAEYLPAPSSGALVSFDSALLVTPPPGMEYGYIPIVISQTGNVVSPPLP